MNFSCTLLVLLISLPVLLAVPNPNRAIWQFRDMMVCTNPDSWPLLDYTDYGCYCGKGGSGTPVDGLDRCCQVHDQCFADAKKHGGCRPILDNPFIEMYWYKCDRPTKTVTCLDDNDPCEMFICECDRVASMCFAASEWNPEHEHLPSDRCH